MVSGCACEYGGLSDDGYIIALYNSDEETLDKWLSMKNPIAYVKQEIYKKHACINVSTPEKELDMTVAPTVIALDSSWHKDSFHHGAFAYHAPFLGWRNWYAPTELGWGERVAKTMEKYFALISRGNVEDGTTSVEKLVYPFSLDDWLTSALTTEAEIFYFSNFNHATVKRIRINPEKELSGITVEAVANEIILGVAGISVSR